MPNASSVRVCQLSGALLLILGALILGCAPNQTDQPAVSSDLTPAQETVAVQTPEQPGQRSPEEWQRRREEMYQQLNLTAEQRARLEEVDRQYAPGSGREAREARRQAMSEILTPEQMEQMRGLFRQRGPRGQEGTEPRPPR